MEYKVPKKYEGLRLLDILKNILIGEWSTRGIKKIIDMRGCFINGQSILISTRLVKCHDVIYVKEAAIQRAQIPRKKIDILYEDESFLAINKPIDVCSEIEAISRLLSNYQDIYLIHRLDKETSGVMLIAKGTDAKKVGEDLFRQRIIKKSYDAIVQGEMEENEGCIETSSYGRLKTEHGQSYWTGKADIGKIASTSWSLKRVKKGLSYLTLSPLTGRTHQLRVHLSELNYPIVGDPLYGNFELNASRMLLHAHTLKFNHPITDKKIYIEAPLPEELLKF